MKNAYVCLVAFQLLFLVGIEHERRDFVCGINALLFHFFGLAVVVWLCLEGECESMSCDCKEDAEFNFIIF